MRNLSQNEVLALNSLLRMEVNGLAVAKAVTRTVGDDKLKHMTETGIDACETRIKGLQQFMVENHIVSGGAQ